MQQLGQTEQKEKKRKLKVHKLFKNNDLCLKNILRTKQVFRKGMLECNCFGRTLHGSWADGFSLKRVKIRVVF